MRVAHPRGDVQLEARVVDDLTVAELNGEIVAHFDRRFVKEIVESRVHNFAHILKQDSFATRHGLAKLFNEIFVVDVKHLKRMLTLAEHLLDPAVGLGLRVDAKSPSITLGDADTVLG